MDVALKIVGVELILSENLRLRSTWRPFDSRFELMKGALVTVEFVSFVVGDSQISLE